MEDNEREEERMNGAFENSNYLDGYYSYFKLK